jgi:hypothetical protein
MGAVLPIRIFLITEIAHYHGYTGPLIKELRGLCERTIPTERPPLVDEVSANFCG